MTYVTFSKWLNMLENAVDLIFAPRDFGECYQIIVLGDCSGAFLGVFFGKV